MSRRLAVLLALGVLALALVLYVFNRHALPFLFSPTPSDVEERQHGETAAPEIVATGLEIPWEVAFIPGGDLLVTERPGRLLRIGAEQAVLEIQGVAHRGEGGLLGMTLHPDFRKNAWVYLYLTTAQAGGLTNRVERYVLKGASLSERTVIIEGIPGASYHDGGRIAFGPDRLLYIATGDAGVAADAQNPQRLSGKILRVHEDGFIPADNPFGNAVYSYGHRNVQGLAWDQSGRLWATEHGRSGVQSGYDELNLIEKGVNYGWPEIEGDERRPGMRTPVAHSGPTETWAPSGMAHVQGHLLFAGLRGETLYATSIAGDSVGSLTAHLRGTYGRLRTVASAPDGALYLLTNNRDGRGRPGAQDDRIIKVAPAALGL